MIQQFSIIFIRFTTITASDNLVGISEEIIHDKNGS